MKYSSLVDVYEELEATTKRLDKTHHLTKLLKSTHAEDIQKIVLLVQGRLYAAWDEREIGVASQMMIKAISLASGIETASVEREWKRTGDLGIVAQELIKKKKQATLHSTDLTVSKVFSNLRKLADIDGSGSVDRKIGLIAELLTSAKSLEAKYIVRTILGQLRVGVGAGSLRDAIVWAYFPKVVGIFFKCDNCKKWNPKTSKCLECHKQINNKFKIEINNFKEKNILKVNSVDDIKNKNIIKYDFILAQGEKTAREIYNFLMDSVQEAYDLTNDFAVVAERACQGFKGLDKISLKIGTPVKVMLALKVNTIEEGFEKVGKPAIADFKLDGFRMQVHKDKDIAIFTRRLENVTKQFPEVVEYVKKSVKAKSFILDCEAVGFNPKTKQYMPFQNISQRIKRKYGIEDMAKELPVELNVFDIIYYNGKNLIKEPFKKRREIIKKIINPLKRKIVVVKDKQVKEKQEVKEFFKDSKKAGNEGVIMKKLDSVYKPGARVGLWVKYKEAMEDLDLVIVGAEWGTGKRAQWLSSFVLACRHKDRFLEIGKVGTGVKEKKEEGVSFGELTKLLKPLIISEKGKTVKVKPEILIEVSYEEIQKSPIYESGFALRFPRFRRLRHMERRPEDASTLEYVKELYKSQKKINK